MKEDRRVKKTKQALINACGDLIKIHKDTTITVKELCDIANINRSTFYAYYVDINDFLNKLQLDIAEDIEEIIIKYHHNKIPFILNRNLIIALFSYFKKKDYFMQAILSRSIMRRVLIEQLRDLLLKVNVFADYPYPDLMANYIAYGLIGIMIEWLNTQQLTVEEISEVTLHYLNGQYCNNKK